MMMKAGLFCVVCLVAVTLVRGDDVSDKGNHLIQNEIMLIAIIQHYSGSF